MRYIPHTDADVARMLEAIGVNHIDELFALLPQSLRLNTPMDLPAPMDEQSLGKHMTDLASKGPSGPCFAGGGAYRHYIPHAVDHVLRRNEFYTAYTPYQPEVSQGTLQAIFEFQTMIARLLGMEVANASMYDSASATAEAVLMAARATRNKKAIVSAGLHPHHLETIRTYTRWMDIEIVMAPLNPDGHTNVAVVESSLDEQTAAVVVQSPNYLGVLEQTKKIGELVGNSKARFVHTFTEPLAFGLVAPPGECGADIACGEGQSLGIPIGYGGPYLGLFAANKKDVRQMPGRICGETKDADDRRAFCLTLSTREQHIRREKATSNICTNHALMALATTVYMALMGKEGLAQVAQLNYAKAQYLKTELAKDFALPFDSPTFNEFVWTPKAPAGEVLAALAQEKITGGTLLDGYAQGLDNAILTCVTELISREEIDRYVEIVRSM